jgi:hypothetical protein
MKSRIILAFTAVLILATAENANAQLFFGVKAGGILSTQSETGELWNNSGLRQGFHVGAFAEYRLTDAFSLQAELNFQEKGTSYDYLSSEGSFRVLRKNDYLNIPLLIKVSVGEKGGLPEGMKLYGFAGPYAGIQVYSKNLFRDGHPQDISGLSDTSTSPDLGAVIGAGVSKKIASGHELFVQVSYEAGLYKIDSQNTDTRNKAAELSLGFRF